MDETTQTLDQPWYISSSGDGLSASIAGLSIAGLVPFVSVVLGWFHISLSTDITTQVITNVIQAGGMLYATFGLVRKAYWAIKG